MSKNQLSRSFVYRGFRKKLILRFGKDKSDELWGKIKLMKTVDDIVKFIEAATEE